MNCWMKWWRKGMGGWLDERSGEMNGEIGRRMEGSMER